MGDKPGFFCDCCGRRRVEIPNYCPHCHSDVCNKCWHSQAKVGHELAEHKHEIAFKEGAYTRGDEDY